VDLKTALERLEHLRDLIERYNPRMYESGEEIRQLHHEVVEAYGAVADVIEQFEGRRDIRVDLDRAHVAVFPNFIEAGYLSGSTVYTHQGHTQLLKVIGKVRQRVASPSSTIEERSVATVIQALRRFRECCQYVKAPPQDERDVQDLVWVILRSHFDRLEREETLSKFGVKGYKPDFGIPELRLLVEVKFIGAKTSPGDIQEEILADVPAYLGEHTAYAGVVVLVYDAAQKLRDPRKFVEDLRQVEGIMDVIVVPGIG
jgi:hypothetical protein